MKVVIIDVGQTLCYSKYTLPESIKIRAKTIFSVLVEELKLFHQKKGEMETIGLNSFPFQEIEENYEEYKAKFTEIVYEKRRLWKEAKDNGNVLFEKKLEEFIAEVLQEGKFINLTEPTKNEENKENLITFLGKVINKDECIVSEFLPFPGVAQTLQKLKEKGYILCICSNTSQAKHLQRAIDDAGITNFFDLIIFSSNVGVRKPNPKIITIIKEKYPFAKDYEICIIGDMINRDILVGQLSNIRTIWFTQNQYNPELNTKEFSKIKPEFIISQFYQIPALLETLGEDANYLNNKLDSPPSSEEAKEESKDQSASQLNYKTPELYKTLPSTHKISIKYYFVKSKDKIVGEKGLISNTDTFTFSPLLLNIPLQEQLPFHIFIHKAHDLMTSTTPTSKALLHTLLLFLNKNPHILVLDNMHSVSLLTSREQADSSTAHALLSNNIQDLCLKYHISVRTPFSFLFYNGNNVLESIRVLKDAFEERRMCAQEQEQMECAFPLLVKPACACFTVNSHLLSLVFSRKGLEEVLQMGEYRDSDVIVQSFVNHYARIHKLYTVGRHVSILVKKSIPSELGKSKSVDYLCFDSQKPFPPDWYDVLEGEEIKEKEINFEFVSQICKELNAELGLNVMGYDFVIQEETGVYYIVDQNYFPGYKHLENFGEIYQAYIKDNYLSFFKNVCENAKYICQDQQILFKFKEIE
jgi:FMN phosphatase YigB (HAD superfamily)